MGLRMRSPLPSLEGVATWLNGEPQYRRTARLPRRRFVLVEELLHVPRFGGTSRRMAR